MVKNSKIKSEKPGVYLFKKGSKILYIGKATSLKIRLQSYFNPKTVKARGEVISKMISLATSIETIETESVLEALILESNLIKKHQPKYNTKEKDDSSFYYIAITKEDFPKLLIKRWQKLFSEKNSENNYQTIFGPYPHSAELKEGIKILRKIFPFRDKCAPNSKKECFNYQLKLCPGVCVGKITKKEYRKNIENLCLFLNGKKDNLIRKIEREMREYSAERNYEKAGEIKRQIFALQHIKDISLIKRKADAERNFRIEAYDISHLAGENTVGAMAVVCGGEIEKNEFRKFKIKGDNKNNDTLNLYEILSRRFEHPEWPMPRLVVVDGGKAQINTANKFLKKIGADIPVVGVVKNEFHKPQKIIGDAKLIKEFETSIILANSEAHRIAIKYHKKKRDVVLDIPVGR